MSYCLSERYAVCPKCGAKGRAFYDAKHFSNGGKATCRMCGGKVYDAFGYLPGPVEKLPPDAIFDSTDYPQSHE